MNFSFFPQIAKVADYTGQMNWIFSRSLFEISRPKLCFLNLDVMRNLKTSKQTVCVTGTCAYVCGGGVSRAFVPSNKEGLFNKVVQKVSSLILL